MKALILYFSSSKNYIQETNGKGWVDMYDTPVFSGGKYFLRLPNNQTIDNYRHIASFLTKVFTDEIYFFSKFIEQKLMINIFPNARRLQNHTL
jgi:hypothetical protein